jgi:outer membrane protein assembly factor BamB
LVLLLGLSRAVAASDWSRFRGPNGSGVAETGPLPAEFGPERHALWQTPLPAGHSSPVLSNDAIFLTAYEEEQLLTICLERATGAIRWQRRVPRVRQEKLDPRNNPASPTPVTDGENVYAFFSEFGLVSYNRGGTERWRLPLGPFNNVYGMGASPILAGGNVLLVCDQSTKSFLVAVGKDDGRVRWKVDRPEAKSGHSTPIVYQVQGAAQLLVPGSFQLTAYAPESGQKLWWVRGLSFEMKSTPVHDGERVYVNGYGSPLNQPGKLVTIAPFAEVLSANDRDGDGRLSQSEVPERRDRGFFGFIDLDRDGRLGPEEWNYYRAAMASTNGMLAIRLGGRGDATESNLVWQEHRSVPQLPSPLLYQGILYMINDGGVATSFEPATGRVIARRRLEGVVDSFYASPVAGDGKIYFVSESGKVAVAKPDGSLGVLAVNDLGERCYATPAIGDGRIYVRTETSLYAFGLLRGGHEVDRK